MNGVSLAKGAENIEPYQRGLALLALCAYPS